MARFRHYLNLGAMAGRLDRLLRDFAWDRIDRVFGPELNGPELGGPELNGPELNGPELNRVETWR
jgi:hypothetical protein